MLVGINAAGHLVAGDQMNEAVFDLNEAVSITIYGQLEAGLHSLVVDAATERQDAVRLRIDLDADALTGALSLVARGKGTRWDFGQWSLSGDAVVAQPEHAVGAIAWSQYTLQDNGQLKLLAQMVPLESTDPQTAELQFKQQGRWQTVAHAELDLLSSTFLFRVESAESLPYRVLYRLEDETYTWEGVIPWVVEEANFEFDARATGRSELAVQWKSRAQDSYDPATRQEVLQLGGDWQTYRVRMTFKATLNGMRLILPEAGSAVEIRNARVLTKTGTQMMRYQFHSLK